VLRRCVDHFYPYVAPYMDDVRALTVADLASPDPARQVEACLLWSAVGEVESDISAPDSVRVKGRHRDFDYSFGYAALNFESLFDPLVGLMTAGDARDTDAQAPREVTPAHAAFTCVTNLAAATGEKAIEPILSFVSANGRAEDWRRRYASALLLSAASQLPSFTEQVRHVLFAFDFFVDGIVDPIPKISEASMWLLGRVIEGTPDLVTDVDRFNRLLDSIRPKLHVSDQLTSRACWLLSTCFSAFFPLDRSSALAQQFDSLSDLLLQASAYFDVDSQEAAMGALSKLIERTPRTLVPEYSRLLAKLTARLAPLLAPDAPPGAGRKGTQLVVGLLALIQAIVMNVGDAIGAEAAPLLRMLVAATHASLASETLPAIGALARAMRAEFAPHLGGLVDLVFAFLDSRQNVRPAAVFLSDILCSGVALDGPLIARIGAALTAELERFDRLGHEARLAVFTALCDFVKCVGRDSAPWIDRYLELLDQEARAVLTLEDESLLEPNRPRSFATVCLQIYQALVPILAGFKNGDRKVRNFFHIFEQLLRLDCIDDPLLADCVVLIDAIAETFKRKMNVFLNKPAVIELLRRAEDSENLRLAALGRSTWAIVKTF
jgi:hypothetical protein